MAPTARGCALFLLVIQSVGACVPGPLFPQRDEGDGWHFGCGGAINVLNGPFIEFYTMSFEPSTRTGTAWFTGQSPSMGSFFCSYGFSKFLRFRLTDMSTIVPETHEDEVHFGDCMRGARVFPMHWCGTGNFTGVFNSNGENFHYEFPGRHCPAVAPTTTAIMATTTTVTPDTATSTSATGTTTSVLPPVTTTPQSEQVEQQCCWSQWGDASTCGGYPTSASGALCNAGYTVPCLSNGDCATCSGTHCDRAYFVKSRGHIEGYSVTSFGPGVQQALAGAIFASSEALKNERIIFAHSALPATGDSLDFDTMIRTWSQDKLPMMEGAMNHLEDASVTNHMKIELQSAGLPFPATLSVVESSVSDHGPELVWHVTPGDRTSHLPLVPVTEPTVVDVCFPGTATVLADGRGQIMMADLYIGDSVLVTRDHANLEFQPVLDFLHQFQGAVEHFSVVHVRGQVTASRNHMLLTVDSSGNSTFKPIGRLRIGDRVLTISEDGERLVPSSVLAVRLALDAKDAYAPLTASGTIVVDGVAASNYASPSPGLVTHAVAHAFLFPVRAFHAVGLGRLCGLQDACQSSSEFHPFLAVTYNRFRIDVLHSKLLR